MRSVKTVSLLHTISYSKTVLEFLLNVSRKQWNTITVWSNIGKTAYQSRGSSECVRLSTSRLAIAESCGAETFYGHLDKPLDSRELQNVFLRGPRFEHHVIRKHSGLGLTCTHWTKLEEKWKMGEHFLPLLLTPVLLGSCSLLNVKYRVIKKSLCIWWLYCNRQVQRDFLITLYKGMGQLALRLFVRS